MKPIGVKWAAAASLLALLATGCSDSKVVSTNVDGSKKLQVVASFYPMAEFTRQVAGDLADVVALVPPGVEPHDWEPKSKDMKRIQDADVFVYNGGGVEHWVDKALESLNKDKISVIEASNGIELMEGMAEEEEEDEHKEKGSPSDEKIWDPHVWLDPVLAQKEVQSIQSTLEKADPSHKDTYKKNADAYIAKLQQLDQAFKDGMKEVKRKEFMTQHAAFAYLAKQYGLVQVPIAGLSPEQEPSAAKMTEIVKFAKEHQVKTIFFETLVSPKVATTIAKEIGAKTAVLNPIEGLTEEDKKNNKDYLAIMKDNLASLKLALSE